MWVMSLFLQAQRQAKAHATVYPAERSAFSEVCDSYSEEDQRLIAEEYLLAWEMAASQGKEFDIDFFEEIEPKLVDSITGRFGRA